MSSSNASAQGPVLILALPRSFSSVVSCMLGQHPQLYGFPELHLFAAEQMTEWIQMAAATSFAMEHGLLRSLAQLFWKEQTEQTVQLARGWLIEHLDFSTGMVFEALRKEVHPRIPVEKGPTLITRTDYMQRAYRLYPNARFIHLVRDPLSYCSSVVQRIREEATRGEVGRWLLQMLYYPSDTFERSAAAPADPCSAQRCWHALNTSARLFLRTVKDSQQITLRGEDLLRRPRETLRGLAEWLGLRTDERAITAMLHPERSPYACFGPPGASYGGDPHFLQSPALRAIAAPSGPAPRSQRALLPDVVSLARELGYEGYG
jgi:hypothetical protein